MSNIFFIYPLDKSTKCLTRIINHIQFEIEGVKVYKIRASESDHDACLKILSNFSKNTLVVFLGHGREDFLYGAVSNEHNSLVSSGYLDEDNEYNFVKREFIHSGNVSVFNGKKVFCLACNTGKPNGLGQMAVEQGAMVYLGFGEIPTSQNEFEERLKKRNVSQVVINRFKGEVNFIIKYCLFKAIKENYSFLELEKLIRLVTNKRAHEIVMNHKGLKNNRLLADALYFFRKQMKLYGDGNLKVN